MIIVFIEIEVNDDDDLDPDEVVKNIKSNLRDTLGHCPYDASIVSCEGGRNKE